MSIQLKRKTAMLAFFFVFLALLLLPAFFNPNIGGVEAQESYPIVYRGPNYEDVDYGNGTHVWRSMPQACWNGSHWVDYVYFRDDVKKCYVVRTGLIAGEVYDSGVAKFWDVNMTEERVKSEVWQVWMWDGKAWKEATLNTPISFSVVTNSTGVYINATRTTSKPNGVLTVIYCFRVGLPLKHWVFWKSNEPTSQTVMIKQVWDLAGFITKCKINGAETSASGIYNATQFLFYSETNPYLVFEDQSSMFEKLEPTSIDFSGKKVIFPFSNWTLVSGESLTIDPATQTYSAESSLSGNIKREDKDTYPPTTETKSLNDYITVGQYKSADTDSVRLYPNAGGTYSEWSVFGASSDWEALKDSSGSNGIATSTVNARHSVNIDDYTLGYTLKGDIYCNFIVETGTVQLIYKRGGTWYSGDTVTGPASTASSNVGSHWTKSEIDNMEVGFKAVSGNCNVTSLSVDVYYYTGSYFYDVWRGYVSFDTSSIPDDVTIVSASLKMAVCSDYSSTDFTVQLYSGINQWTDSSTLAWNDCPTLEGTFLSTSGIAKDTYYSASVKPSSISKTGRTQFRLVSSREGTKPSGSEYISFYYSGNYIPKLEVTYSYAPSIGEFQAPSTVYANQYFYLNATINDADGVADFVNATVELNGTIILKWVNSTNTFSEYSDPNNYCTLDASGSIKTQLNDTAYKLSWKIKLYWNYTEGSISIISSNTKVFDSAGASGGNSISNLFYFEDDLIVYSANVDDNHVDPSQSITVTGTIYYNGTTTPPEDTSGITAKVELDGTVKNSTSTINSDGSFSITFNTEASVGSYNYNVYCVTDENSVQNQTVNVIVDKMVITITANTTSPLPEAYVNFTVTAKYAYDNQPVTDWTVNILRDNMHFTTGTTFTDGGYTETVHTYKVENASENLYGLTAFESEPLSVYWSYYVALTVQVKDLDGEILPDATVHFNDEPIQVDQDGLATKTQITANNIVAVKVEWHGVWVNGTWTVNVTETKTITATCNVWTLTILAKDNKGNMLTTSPTEFHITLPNNTYISVSRTDGIYAFKVMNGTSYFRVKFQDQWVSTNLTVPMTNKNVTIVYINCWVYSLTVYVQSTANSYQPNSPIVGASLTLYRTTDNKTLNGLYGLPVNPQTQSYNSTHAVYIWSQLANQTSSYTVTATYGSQSSSTTTSLTQNTQIEIELYVSAPAPYYPPAPIPTTYTLTLTVTKLDQPVANLKIEIYKNNLLVASGQTDLQGKYTVRLTPGTYQITIHLNGETKTETVNLTEPKTLQITIPGAPTSTIERFLRMSVILIIVMIGMVIVPKIVKRR